MKLFACVNHDGFWPVGVASIVIASSEPHARQLLDEALGQRRLKGSTQSPYDFIEIPIDRPVAMILHDGNY